MIDRTLITKEIERQVEILQIERKDEAFTAQMKEYLKLDNKYAKEGDVKLTEEQRAEVEAFWGKYSFAFDIPYVTMEAFMNRTGKFDVRYLPYGVRKGIIADYIRDKNYRSAFQNKAYFDRIYNPKRHPRIICRKVEGIYYDSDFNRITLKKAIKLCKETLERKEIVIKPSGLSGGSGVVFLAEADEARIKQEFEKIPKLMVVQEALKQHPKMAALNPTTVNTVRLTTYIDDKEIIPVAALVKIGNAATRVDNYKHGGHILGVDLQGNTYPYALNVNYDRVTILPTGVDLSKGMVIPGFASVLEAAKEGHLRTPRIKVISWDIAINADAEAVIIEANHSGDFRMHQALTGPLFGDLTESFLNKYLVKKFYRERANLEWNFNEYFNRVELTKYAGFDQNVVVPEEINGKPVRALREGAFTNNKEVVSVTIPDSVKRLGKKAFAKCKNLQSITGGNGLEKIGENAFNATPELSQEIIDDLKAKVKNNSKK